MVNRVLDWVPRFDPRSRDFPIRAVVRESVRRRNKQWRVGPILDQGSEGACVGFGWAAEAFATPTTVNLQRVTADVPREPEAFARELYRHAKRIDEWEGENYDGTSVLAGAKVMSSLKLLREYRWAFSLGDVIDAVLAKGPVVLGVPWRSGMYEAEGGVLRLSGEIVGGHCLLAVGYRLADPRLGGEDGLVLQNSWGRGWGDDGLAVISLRDAELLLAEGEACVPVKRSYGR